MTRTTRKTVCFIVIMLFVVGVITFFAFATSGFKNWNANTWFKSEPVKVSAPAKEDPNGTDDRGEGSEQEDVSDETAGELVNTSASAFSVLTSAVATEPYTYDTLPEGARHINVGDDLSGKIIVFDFPNFLKNKPAEYANFGFMSVTDINYTVISYSYNYGTGAQLTTSGGYSVYLNNSSANSDPHACYLRNNSTSSSVMDFYTVKLVTFQSGSSPSETSSKYEINRSVITGFKLPDNVGTVTEYPVKTKQMYSGGQLYDHHEYTNCYILDAVPETPETPETPENTVLSECPYDGCTFENCGIPLQTGESYTGGYLAVCFEWIEDDNRTIFTVNSYNSVYVESGHLYYKYLIDSTTYKSVELNAPGNSGYVYLLVDLPSVRWHEEALSLDMNGFRYLAPHEHLDVLTEIPYTDLAYTDGVEIIAEQPYNNGYGTGYLAFAVAASQSFIQTNKVVGTSVKVLNNYISGVNEGLYIENNALVYKKHCPELGMGTLISTTVVDSTTASDYVYVELDLSGTDYVLAGAPIKYLSKETYDVTVYTVTGEVTLNVRKNTVFDYDNLSDVDKAKLDLEHYTFEGLSTLPDLSEPYEPTTITSDTALYGVYTPVKYKVMFYSVYGDVTVMEVFYGEKVEDLPAPERTGYAFKGWYTADGTEYTDQAIRGMTVLNAKWALEKYSVIIMIGDKVYTEQTAEYGSKVNAVTDTVDFKGNAPLGLYLDKACTKVVTAEDIITSNTVIYAQFKAPVQDKPTNTVKPAPSWWERNMWYVLAPIITVVALVVLFFIGKTAKKRGK